VISGQLNPLGVMAATKPLKTEPTAVTRSLNSVDAVHRSMKTDH
jgi:hypothetical protein